MPGLASTRSGAEPRDTAQMAAPSLQQYTSRLRWTGNRGSGTASYDAYGRDHEVSAPGKPPIPGSSDPRFRGDPARWNPEELLVSAVAECHMLWYLHLAADAGVVVTDYADTPIGTLEGTPDGVGKFREVVLHPAVTVAEASMVEPALGLHEHVGALCAIGRSVAFPIHHQPTARVAGSG